MTVRQEVGGGDVMALALRKVARHWTPAGQRNFRSWGGRILRPLLFVALYLLSRIYDSSVGVMRLWSGSVRGVYLSGWMSSSWNSVLLYLVKSSRGTCTSSALLLYHSPELFWSVF